MSKSYQYLSDSFLNGVNLDKLTLQIMEDVTINKTLEGSINDGTNVIIVFAQELISEEKTSLDLIVSVHDGQPIVYTATDIEYYLNGMAVIEDPVTHIDGPFEIMQSLMHRKDLYNDTDSPLYEEGHVPILGENGLIDQLNSRSNNIDIIHSKTGWHQQEVKKGIYKKPARLLIYYGYVNSFNYIFNQWNNELVAQDMSQYDIIVLGDGVGDPSHGDYANTQIVIPRIKAIKPNILIFGYVSATETLDTFKIKSGQWNTLQIHGILIDEAGYDYGRTRSQMNEMVDHVHSLEYSKLVFANAWNTGHLLGKSDDANYPNLTYNSSLIESTMTSNDWILLESFPINTTSYSGNNGFESKYDWATRGLSALSLRYTYGLNFAACGTIANDAPNGDDLFHFGHISSMMWSLEAFGVSDTNYASSSATVRSWCLFNVEDPELTWSMNPSVQNNLIDNDIYYRYLDQSRLVLDFSTGAQRSTVESMEPKANIRETIKIYESFIGATLSSHLFSASTDGTGALAAIANTTYAGRPGIITLETGTTTTGRSAISSNLSGISVGDGMLKIEYSIMIPTLSDGNDSYTVRIGAGDSNSGEPADGIYFRYNQSNANWICVSRSNNSETATALSYSTQANTWYRLSFETNFNATKVKYFINGNPVAMHTANIPTGTSSSVGLLCSIIKSAGATNRTLNIDYGWIEYDLNNCR